MTFLSSDFLFRKREKFMVVDLHNDFGFEIPVEIYFPHQKLQCAVLKWFILTWNIIVLSNIGEGRREKNNIPGKCCQCWIKTEICANTWLFPIFIFCFECKPFYTAKVSFYLSNGPWQYQYHSFAVCQSFICFDRFYVLKLWPELWFICQLRYLNANALRQCTINTCDHHGI